MTNKKALRGSSTTGTMVFIIMLIFAGITAAKLWSPYYDDMAVDTALNNMIEEPATRAMSPREIRDTLNKRLQVNSVALGKDEVSIRREDGKTLIDIVYERRVPMYGNVDAVVRFEHAAQL